MNLFRFIISQLRHARRYNRVVSVLLKYGFDDYVANLDKNRRFSLVKLLVPKWRRKRAAQFTKWERMRMACEELGPTFIKFGQLLSNRRDLIPAPLIAELIHLQDHVPAVSSKIIRKVIREELKAEPEKIFATFCNEPLACASMAQVHKATLKSGEEVAVKIQRPEIRKMIEEDLKIMRDVAQMLSKRMPSIKHFDPVGLVDQFDHSIHFEMDFLHEAVNMKRFEEQMSSQPEIRVPRIYDDLCTIRVLTMEMVQGLKPSTAEALKNEGIDPKWVARTVITSFFEQAFVKGFFHADPHAGNLVVANDKIYFLDFGMMGTILRKDMQQLGALVLSIQDQDVQQMMRAIMVLTDTVQFDNRRQLEYDLIEFINRFAYTPDFHMHVSEMLAELTVIIRQHNLKVPAHFFLLTRACFAIEGLVRQLDPEIELMTILRPVVEARVRQEANPLSTGKRILKSLYDLAGYLEEFPSDLRQTMRMIRRGKFKVDLEHKGMEPFVYTLRKVTQQMIAAIMVSAIFLGSVILLILDVGQTWHGISIAGLIGLIISGMVGFIVMLRILRLQDEYRKKFPEG
jgi:ubiquinone biosynthesis protein